MLIFGHEAIVCKRFAHVKSIEEIRATSADQIVYFYECDDMDFCLSKHCHKEKVPYAVRSDSLVRFLIYAQLQASFVLVDSRVGNLMPRDEHFLEQERQSPVKRIQTLADHYLLDTKVLLVIKEEREMELAAFLGIDGVIFSHFLV
ncbi:MAG: hypothetical protein ACTTH5_08165 [Wolinella sp.]